LGEPLVVAKGLTKRLGRREVVNGVTFEVERGSVFGFLGPNGAGKTTTIRMLLRLVYPDSGEVMLFGRPLRRHPERLLGRVGAFIEGPGYVPYLSARANLGRFLAAERVSRRERASRTELALAAVGLERVAEVPVSRYSLGMRQRLGLAQTLVAERDLYVLDEPSNGLDPSGMREVRRLILELAASGKTVLLSTHLLAEAEQICTHIGLMSQGRLIKSGALEDLRRLARPQLVIEGEPVALLAELLPGIEALGGGRFLVEGPLASDPAALARRVIEGGVALRSMTPVTASLEQVFVSAVGEGFDVR
jgi:ABC-2 type transport system ATP-binding protein